MFELYKVYIFYYKKCYYMYFLYLCLFDGIILVFCIYYYVLYKKLLDFYIYMYLFMFECLL